ncbi:MAG: hypothetical protein Q8896_13035 [Bacteroidota bacterium]|nr:hypothetical protein [Bacteroidota bacterium]
MRINYLIAGAIVLSCIAANTSRAQTPVKSLDPVVLGTTPNGTSVTPKPQASTITPAPVVAEKHLQPNAVMPKPAPTTQKTRATTLPKPAASPILPNDKAARTEIEHSN